MPSRNVLVYLPRRDLRVSDNPILHHLATAKDHGFTHLLPVFVYPADQIEISGFLKDPSAKSPYPEARSKVGRYWRCGPYRAKFITQSVWGMKQSLEALDSGLLIRVGSFKDVLHRLLSGLKERGDSGAVWMVGDEGLDEIKDEAAVSTVCKAQDFAFKKWVDEKYFIDDRDLNFGEPRELPYVFTDYRKSVEPLREKPRKPIPKPKAGSLPPFPSPDTITDQAEPFSIPDAYEALEKAVLEPVKDFFSPIPKSSDEAVSAHPFEGGEAAAQARLQHIMNIGLLKDYKTSRNGLIGEDFSTKLSAYLAQGCITARQIHEALVTFEDGTDESLKDIPGYGEGENVHTKSVREELMWRDYMRLYARKIKGKLFSVEGLRGGGGGGGGGGGSYDHGGSAANNSDGSGGTPPTSPPTSRKVIWMTPDADSVSPLQSPSPDEIRAKLERFKAGTTGLGLIDASMRELLHTGYTSNRARQNAASFLAKHLGIDWRYGAEWYEMLLVDYDVCSNWANWQYVAGVGNDPRGEARIFNPVKQAFDYDKGGEYVKMWVPELAPLAERLEHLFQPSTAPREALEAAGLAANPMAVDPVKRIRFNPDGKPPSKRPWKKKTPSPSADAAVANGCADPAADANHNHSHHHHNQQQHARGGGGGGRHPRRGGPQGYSYSPRGGGAYRGYHNAVYGGPPPLPPRGGGWFGPGPGRGVGYYGRGAYMPQPYRGGAPYGGHVG